MDKTIRRPHIQTQRIISYYSNFNIKKLYITYYQKNIINKKHNNMSNTLHKLKDNLTKLQEKYNTPSFYCPDDSNISNISDLNLISNTPTYTKTPYTKEIVPNDKIKDLTTTKPRALVYLGESTKAVAKFSFRSFLISLGLGFLNLFI